MQERRIGPKIVIRLRYKMHFVFVLAMAYFGDIIVKKSGSCLRFSLVSSTPLGYKHPCCPLSLRENLWRSQSSICLDVNSQGTDNSDYVISLKWLWLINKERSYFFPNNFYDK